MAERSVENLRSAQTDSDPSSGTKSRFTSTSATAEDVLKSQTVGLVQLSDFRKRRAEVLEQHSRDVKDTRSRDATPDGGLSSASTPASGSATPNPAKKKKRAPTKGKLSFGLDEGESDDSPGINIVSRNGSATPVSRSGTPSANPTITGADTSETEDAIPMFAKRKLGPNSKVSFVPRAQTKNALLKEAQTREQLRREYLSMQARVKATEIILPFVFYDGSNIPGGRCRIRKGEHIWLFLDRARKVGAELGVGGSGDRGRREWARVSVDDLILVRNEIIVPHHYDFYYFLVNKTVTYDGRRLFGFSAEPTAASPKIAPDAEAGDEDLSNYDPMAQSSRKSGTGTPAIPDEDLEGTNDDPAATKVVDRRWYERNKHIYPASTWEEFDATKDYAIMTKKDAQGNAFFFT